MVDQIIDKKTVAIPGPMGDVTPRAERLLDDIIAHGASIQGSITELGQSYLSENQAQVARAEAAADRAEASGVALGAADTVVGDRLKSVESFQNLNGLSGPTVYSPVSDPSEFVPSVPNMTGVSVRFVNTSYVWMMLRRAWRIRVKLQATGANVQVALAWFSEGDQFTASDLHWTDIPQTDTATIFGLALPPLVKGKDRLALLARTSNGVAPPIKFWTASYDFSFIANGYQIGFWNAGWSSTGNIPAFALWLDLKPAQTGLRADSALIEDLLVHRGEIMSYDVDWLYDWPALTLADYNNISSVIIPLVRDQLANVDTVSVHANVLKDGVQIGFWLSDGRQDQDHILANATYTTVNAGEQDITVRLPPLPVDILDTRTTIHLWVFLKDYGRGGQVQFYAPTAGHTQAVFDQSKNPTCAYSHQGTILQAVNADWVNDEAHRIPMVRFGSFQNYTPTPTLIDTFAGYSPLNGKSMVFIGDSWCAGSGDGAGAWANLIKQSCPNSTIENHGHAGADWWQAGNNYHFPFNGSTPPDPLPDTADYVVVQAYTNGLYQNVAGSGDTMTDGRSPAPLPIGKPDLDSFPKTYNDLTTLYPADSNVRRCEWVLSQIARKYASQGTKLLLILPYRAPSQAGSKNAFAVLRPYVIQLAEKYGFAIYDRFQNSQVPYWDSKLAEPFMWHKTVNGEEAIDDTHLGLAGNKLITPGILHAMESL